MVVKPLTYLSRRAQQDKERQDRIQARNHRELVRREEFQRKRRQSWIRPWIYACRHIRSFPVEERAIIFQTFIPLDTLPRGLVNEVVSNSVSPSSPVLEWHRAEEELGTPLGTFPVLDTSQSSSVLSTEPSTSITGKGEYNVIQNPSYLSPIKPLRLFEQTVINEEGSAAIGQTIGGIQEETTITVQKLLEALQAQVLQQEQDNSSSQRSELWLQ